MSLYMKILHNLKWSHMLHRFNQQQKNTLEKKQKININTNKKPFRPAKGYKLLIQDSSTAYMFH